MAAHRLSEDAKGVYIISATPFLDDGEIDFASADRLVEFYIEAGVSGITILGMMGEANKLAPDEAEQFLRHMLKRVAERVPVVVGVSSAGLDNLAKLSEVAMGSGAAGVMIAPPAGLTTDEKLYNYFAAVFAALGPEVPVCYQDFPLSTGVAISPSLFNRMVADFPQLVMLKHEDWPGLPKLSAVRASAEAAGVRRVSILCGNGGLYLPQELARGADGAMTGFAYPEMLVGVVSRFAAGDADGAEDLFDAYLPLVRHEQQPGFGLAVRKEILRRRGLLTTARTRAPGPSLTATDQAELDRLTRRLDAHPLAVHRRAG
jgi:4-hydroxy-tetrahydrodipicolinate synthase